MTTSFKQLRYFKFIFSYNLTITQSDTLSIELTVAETDEIAAEKFVRKILEEEYKFVNIKRTKLSYSGDNQIIVPT